ncbi:shufflon-specific DNA recombinase [Salmonella enterica]|nr:shufflon-specific DNA recombinase [Salmonella enterica]
MPAGGRHKKVAAWFVPYPAHITTINEENGQKAHRIEIGDFDNLHVTATTKEEAVHRASEVLLRTLAIAAQKANVSHLPERYLLTTLTTL